MKIAEIRELSTKELVERIEAEAVAQIKLTRRMIARMKGELRQRELNKQ